VTAKTFILLQNVVSVYLNFTFLNYF